MVSKLLLWWYDNVLSIYRWMLLEAKTDPEVSSKEYILWKKRIDKAQSEVDYLRKNLIIKINNPSVKIEESERKNRDE